MCRGSEREREIERSKVENATQKANAKAIATECSAKKKKKKNQQQHPQQQRKRKTNRASCPGGN